MAPLLLVSLAIALSAPPAEATPAGVPPYLLELRADNAGSVKLPIFRTVMKKVTRFNIEKDRNGESVYREVEVVEPFLKPMVVEFKDLLDLQASTAGGKELTIRETLERIGRGTVVVVSSDGNKVDAAFTSVFKDDAIVLRSPDLAVKSHELLREPNPKPPGR